ncbi:MAG: hypothetical protein ACK5QE_02770 [Sphingobacteriia bacterium]
MNNLPSFHPTSCATDLSYLRQCCPGSEHGGIRNVILVDKYYQPTLMSALNAAGDSATAQLAAWQAANTAGKIIILANVLGEYDGGTPNESQGYGGTLTRITGMDHSATVEDLNVVGNRAFADAALRSQRHVLWFATERLIWNTHATCGIAVTMPVEREYNSELRYIYTFKWSTTSHPQHYWLPEALLVCADEEEQENTIGFEIVNNEDSDVSFLFTYNPPPATSLTIDLVSVIYNNGTTSTEVLNTFEIFSAEVEPNLPDLLYTAFRKNQLVMPAGTYTFHFELESGSNYTPASFSLNLTVS